MPWSLVTNRKVTGKSQNTSLIIPTTRKRFCKTMKYENKSKFLNNFWHRKFSWSMRWNRKVKLKNQPLCSSVIYVLHFLFRTFLNGTQIFSNLACCTDSKWLTVFKIEQYIAKKCWTNFVIRKYPERKFWGTSPRTVMTKIVGPLRERSNPTWKATSSAATRRNLRVFDLAR